MTKARLATLAGDVAAGARTSASTQPAVPAPAKPEARREAKADVKSEAKSETKPKAKWETEPEAKSGEKTEAAAESKPEAKPELKIAAKPEPKSKSKPESSREAKSEPKPETKLETKREAKFETKPEAKLETKPEAKTKAKPEAKTDATLAKDLDCSDTINAAACRESKRIQAKIDRDCGRPAKWGDPPRSADCKVALAAKEKERDGFRRILHAEDKDPQYASITTGMAEKPQVEEVDQETKLENADKRLGYATISSDDFARDGKDLATSHKKIALVGSYLKIGGSERFYISRITAMLARTGNSTDQGITLLTDQAPEELRTFFLKCSGFAADVEISCSARIRGRVISCPQSGSNEVPCLMVEGGQALPE